MKEIERKLYTLAIGFVGVAIMTFAYTIVPPLLSESAVRALVHSGIGPRTIVNAETFAIQLIAAFISVPLLKATRHHLSIADALIVSLPPALVAALSFCDGFELWLLFPILVWPVLYALAFRILSLRAIPSLVDDFPGAGATLLQLTLSLALSFQFAGLLFFLSGAAPPFRLKLVYLLFSIGACLALSARLKPRLPLVALAVGLFLYNGYLFFVAVPVVGPYECPSNP